MELSSSMAAFAWLILCLVLAGVEAVTVQLVSIWFALGALAAMLPAILGTNFTVQLSVFVVVSVLLLAVTRPLVKKKLAVKKVETNAKAVIGQVGVVTEEVTAVQGRVEVDDLSWSARSQTGEPIAPGEEVLVKEIQGVKLIVERIY